MKNLLYRNRNKTVHDLRILKTLKDRFNVQEVYSDKANAYLEYSKNQDLFLFGPLTDPWFSENFKRNQKTIIGLSWGYDLISEINDDQLLSIAEKNISYCSKIIVDSEISKNILIKKFRFKGEILNIPYGCDVKHFSALKKNKNVESNIAILRNWSDIHNNEFILEAIKMLTPNYEGTVNIAGEGTNKKNTIDKFMKNAPGVNTVVFNSNLVDYCKAISNSGIYVSASNIDGTSVTLLEAMSASLISIVPDIPTNHKWILNGINGFTYRANEIVDLVSKINLVLGLSEAARAKITSEAFNTVNNYGNWITNQKQLINFVKNKTK